MLEEMEEVFDCIGLVQDNEYYIKLYKSFTKCNNFIELSKNFNGVFTLIEDVTYNYKYNAKTCCYKFINENNMQIILHCLHYRENDSYLIIFNEDESMYGCKMYKINKTEYVLK